MGRIAEALKRAQQERAQRTEGSVLGSETGPHAPGETEFDAGGDAQSSNGGSAGFVSRSSIVTPPPPQPFAVTTPPIESDCIGPQVVALHDPASDIAEKFRSARTRLVTGNPDGSARVFAVTSSLPKEGKTTTTANLGFSLAELRHLRVAIIDCDFRHRGLSKVFSAADKPGIAEFIRGDKSLAEVCLPAVRNNLFLIPAGDLGDTYPSELLSGRRVAAAFKEINERFHYTLIDAPATNTVADTGLIAPLCHSVVIVIRMGRTPEPLLQRCVRMLQANHVEIAGSILVGYCEKTMGYTDTHDYYDIET